MGLGPDVTVSPTAPPPTSSQTGEEPAEDGVLDRIPAVVRETLLLTLLAASAVLALLVAPDRGLTWDGLLLALAPLPAVAFRRRAPLAAFLAVEALAVGARVAFGPNGPADLVVVVAMYAVASRCRPRWAAVAVVVDVVAMAAAVSMGGNLSATELRGEVIGQVAIGVVVVLVGLYAAARRARMDALRDRAARLARTSELEARAAVEDERRRIARELHDVVAHHVSVMTLHAGALQRQLERAGADGELAAAAGEMRATGQEAMRELRRMLGVLHDGDDAERGPQPNLTDLAALADRMREAGMAVTVTATGPLEDVPAGMALSIFRIAQEALTNTLRHAGPVPADLTVAVEPERVRLWVRDHPDATVPPTYQPGEPSSGHGLAGMRERAALYAGSIVAGPHPDGGFLVEAELPRVAPAVQPPRRPVSNPGQ